MQDILALRKSVGDLPGCLLVNGQPASSAFIKHTSYVQSTSPGMISSILRAVATRPQQASSA